MHSGSPKRKQYSYIFILYQITSPDNSYCDMKTQWVLFLFCFFGFQVGSATLLCNYHAQMFVDFFEKFCILLSPCSFLSNFNFYVLTQSIMPRSSLMFPRQNFIMKTWHFSDLLAQLKLKEKNQHFKMRYFSIFQSHSANNADIFQRILCFASKAEWSSP